MSIASFLFFLVIFGGPLLLIGYVIREHLRETRRRWAAAEFIQAGREADVAHGDWPHVHRPETFR